MNDEIKTLKLKCEVCGYPVVSACPTCGAVLCGTHRAHDCNARETKLAPAYSLTDVLCACEPYETKPAPAYETKPMESEPKGKRGRKPKL